MTMKQCAAPTHTKLRRNSRKLTGPLAEPIRVKHYHPTLVGLSADEAAQKNAACMAAALQQLIAKIDLLFPHFEVQRTGNAAEDPWALVLAMAFEWVPGFQFVDADKPRRGCPTKWDALTYMVLLADVAARKRGNDQISDAQALADLISNPRSRWHKFQGGHQHLANMLAQARDPEFNPVFPLLNAVPEGLERDQALSIFASQ